MTIYYVDSSALVKRYVLELGSAWITQLTSKDGGNIIVICDLTQVEVFSALERKKHDNRNTLTAADCKIFQAQFLVDALSEYKIVTVNQSVFSRARDLVTYHRKLRSLDAIHLASAIEYRVASDGSVTFVTADKDLLGAAHAEGFVTENPENHP